MRRHKVHFDIFCFSSTSRFMLTLCISVETFCLNMWLHLYDGGKKPKMDTINIEINILYSLAAKFKTFKLILTDSYFPQVHFLL